MTPEDRAVGYFLIGLIFISTIVAGTRWLIEGFIGEERSKRIFDAIIARLEQLSIVWSFPEPIYVLAIISAVSMGLSANRIHIAIYARIYQISEIILIGFFAWGAFVFLIFALIAACGDDRKYR